MKRWIATLLIFCLALGGMTACKSKDEKKATASAGTFVEGEQQEEQQDIIIENQGGGTSQLPSEDDTTPTPNEPDEDKTPDSDQDNGKNETPVDPDKDEDKTPVETPDKEDEKQETPKNDNEEDEDVDYKSGNKIKILDYNLRYTDDPNGRSIIERALRLEKVMETYTPDICGFQEIVPTWVDCISLDYPDYGYNVKYRAQNSKEGTMVMWNTKTMEKIETGHFWLSPTPEVESSGDAAWGKSGFFRIVTWAKVKVKATGSIFVYFSTHQNNAGTHPVNSGKTIVTYAKKLGVGTKFGGFCMGDYNVTPWSDGYVAMLEGNVFSDINDDLEQSSATTVNGYHTGSSTRIIDFVFYTPAKVAPLHYEVVDMEIDGNYVSDHRGIYAEAALLY